MNKPTISKIWIELKDDTDPDTSYLTQPEFVDRLSEYRADQFGFIGIIAKAQIVSSAGLIQTIHSGGLWGVESDSDKDYIGSIELDELASLRKELESLSIGFGRRAIAYAFSKIERKTR